ncbi:MULTISPECIES: recombinase family protein [Aliarcobacter]|jgi:DNA invertase Pin-like site-specific DNA recombinase|uniref:Resolvase n=2 Tax=Aliarcobacter TaxID=2321111 RepID=A0A7L5JLS2_9BACT|nr:MULTISPECIES: recombinase family protein [Aliarcobacter]MBP6163909.1 recombinase family protein [Aliarcobacter sp.]MBP7226494.1 recombinase family protein [Aliarcobacter sp.]MCG3684604.1 recombinase family protein [Aliarcobacter butzleri]MCG3707294.1 recombinase family protein [Aliarcobacter butzleri]MDS1371601.1 recombinase family protein [Aliarcobacter butzleri]
MLIGYARVSKSDNSQVLDLQIDALTNSGVKEENIYSDKISGSKDARPGLENCLKALREDDILVVYKLDRLGRNLKHLIQTVEDLTKRKIGFKVLSGQGVNIDTTTPAGKMIFSIFGALAEFERELIRERTIAGITAARARGRMGGRKFNLTKAQVRLAEASMKNRDTSVTELCKELKITRATLYKYISPNGELRDYAKRVLEK